MDSTTCYLFAVRLDRTQLAVVMMNKTAMTSKKVAHVSPLRRTVMLVMSTVTLMEEPRSQILRGWMETAAHRKRRTDHDHRD
jgi:hypothetical protein